MFQFFRSHMRLFQFVLVLLIFPSFVFLGVEGYSSMSGDTTTVAKVAGQSVTQAQWDAAHRKQIERIRAQSPEADLKLFDTQEMKLQSLEALLRERVLDVAADKLRLSAGDDRLQRAFASDPQLAFLRKPDGSLNTEVLQAQGMNAEVFEQQLRRDLAVRQVLGGVGGTAFAPAAASETALDALLQRREVRVARFDTKDYAAKAKPSDAEVEAYYKDPQRARDFEAPERASIEYLVLDLDALKAGVSVNEAEVRKLYDDNLASYTEPEERRASHILFAVPKSASASVREKANAKASAVLAEVRKNPARFGELAKKNSDDPSAAQGGDLGFFTRDAMVKPFADAAFGMKPKDIGDVVETEYGYHIIAVTEARGGQRKPFEAVRGEIEATLRQQAAQRKFTEAAESFTNLVYEQSDSLKPTAEKLKLQLRTATAVTRTPAQGASDALASPKFLNALFASEVVGGSKRNTEAIDIGANRLVAGRVVDYAPARKLPFEDVKELVRLRAQAEQAADMARKAGQAKLAAWKDGQAPEGLATAVAVSRTEAQGLPREALVAIMTAPTTQLPAWLGVDLAAQGYAVVRIDKLLPRDASSGDPQSLQAQYAQVWGAAETQAYYDALKQRYKARVTTEAKATSPEATPATAR